MKKNILDKYLDQVWTTDIHQKKQDEHKQYGYNSTNLWNCPAVIFLLMLRNDIAEQVLESAVEPLNVLKIAKARSGCQSFYGQKEIVLNPILKIQHKVFHQIVNEWVVMLNWNMFEL